MEEPEDNKKIVRTMKLKIEDLEEQQPNKIKH
jgi:hypothetical protein